MITKPTKDQLAPLSASVMNEDALPRHRAPLWSASTGLNTRSTIEMGALDAQVDWTTDFLEAAQNDLNLPKHRKQSVIGIGCPKPIGIVTYEDVLDALLQKTSLDEKDFFDRENFMPPTKGRKEGDDASVSSNHSIVKTRKVVPAYVQRLQAAFERSGENKGTLRRRNISGLAACNEEVSEPSGPGFDGTNDNNITLNAHIFNDRSSYTEKSIGGFHGPNCSTEGSYEAVLPSLWQKNDSETSPKLSTLATSTITLTSEVGARIAGEVGPVTATVQPKLRRVTPFSTQASLSYKSTKKVEYREQTTVAKSPPPSIHNDVSIGGRDRVTPVVVGMCETYVQDYRKTRGALSTCLGSEFHQSTRPGYVNSMDPVLAVVSNYSNIARRSSPEESKIRSRVGKSAGNKLVVDSLENEEIQPREESFHDDRTLLPSQRKRRDRKSHSRERRISLWF